MKKSIELGGAAIILAIVVVFGILYLNPHLKMSQQQTAAVKTPQTQTAQQQTTSPQAVGKSYSEVAVATSTVTLRGCQPTPKVVKVTNKTPVTFVNVDSVHHKVSFAPTINYAVPAKGSVKADFSKWERPGVRKYNCDDQANVGQIYIIN